MQSCPSPHPPPSHTHTCTHTHTHTHTILNTWYAEPPPPSYHGYSPDPLYTLSITHFANIIGAQASSNAVFGQGITSSPILLSDVSCTSLESSLFDCPNADLNYINTCGHQQDAGVKCAAGNVLSVDSLSLYSPFSHDCLLSITYIFRL